MINAVLVFNNNGQPRLTKFYTQLVSSQSRRSDIPFKQQLTIWCASGYTNPTISHRPNIPPCRTTAGKRLQLPPSPPAPLPRRSQLLCRRALWRPHSNYIPHLCHSIFHYDLYLNRIPARFDRSNPGLCRGTGPDVRECLRVGLDLRLWDNACGFERNDCWRCSCRNKYWEDHCWSSKSRGDNG